MSTNAATLERIAREETDRFLDSQFAPLDVSGCISLLKPPSEEDCLPDPRFAPLDARGVGLGAAALKRGIEELVNDPEVQEQVARETGNPEIFSQYQNNQAERVARDFMRQNPSYHRSQQNWEMIVQTLAFNAFGWAEDEASVEEAQAELIKRGFWTIENLTSAFKALDKAGSLESKPGLPRKLTEHERRAIALQAGSGDVEGAITRYLQFRLPENVVDEVVELFGVEEVMDRLADPELKQVVAEAVYFCWEQSRCDYCPSTARRGALREYVGNRIPTARLLDAAWSAVQRHEADAMRTGLLQQFSERELTQQSAPDLESLDDAEVDRLYRATLKKIAVDSRR